MIPDAELQELLSTLDPTTRTLVAEVDLGSQAREFLQSEIGHYLTGCVQQEIAEANLALGKVAPWRRRRIQELQNRRWRAESLLSWLCDLLVSAQSATSALEERES